MDPVKAAIVYLVKNCTSDLIESLKALHRYFNAQYDYPILIFHEELTDDDKKHIDSLKSGSITYIQLTPFDQLPNLPHLDPQLIQKWCEGKEGGRKARLGYKQMCRFYAYELLVHPALDSFDYYWRFDDDSFLYAPIDYDPFAYMQQNQLIYGYRSVEFENPREIVGMQELWSATKTFAKAHKLSRRYLKKLCTNWKGRYKGFNYYNNFEINNITFWRSHPLYKVFFDYLDQDQMGFYKYRWGDSNFRAMITGLFLRPEQVHHFKEIAYRHNDHYSIPGGDRIVYSLEGNPFETTSF